MIRLRNVIANDCGANPRYHQKTFGLFGKFCAARSSVGLTRLGAVALAGEELAGRESKGHRPLGGVH